MKQLHWPAALVVTAAIIGLVVLNLMHVDADQFMWLIWFVLGGLGFGQLSALREQTNGNQTEQLRMIREMAEKLANMPPPRTPPKE